MNNDHVCFDNLTLVFFPLSVLTAVSTGNRKAMLNSNKVVVLYSSGRKTKSSPDKVTDCLMIGVGLVWSAACLGRLAPVA